MRGAGQASFAYVDIPLALMRTPLGVVSLEQPEGVNHAAAAAAPACTKNTHRESGGAIIFSFVI